MQRSQKVHFAINFILLREQWKLVAIILSDYRRTLEKMLRMSTDNEFKIFLIMEK